MPLFEPPDSESPPEEPELLLSELFELPLCDDPLLDVSSDLCEFELLPELLVSDLCEPELLVVRSSSSSLSLVLLLLDLLLELDLDELDFDELRSS